MRRPIVSLLMLALAGTGFAGSASAANVAVLMPGSGGITPGDFLVRNQQRFGFFRQDGPAVAAIIGFIRSR